MAKPRNNKNAETPTEPDDDVDIDVGDEETNGAPVVEVSAAEKLKKFNVYEGISTEIGTLEATLAGLKARRSEQVKDIFETCGGAKTYKWKGRELTISKRGSSYYFRGRGDAEVEEIG